MFLAAILILCQESRSDESAARLVKTATSYRKQIQSTHLRLIQAFPKIDALPTETNAGEQYISSEREIWNDFANEIYRCDSYFRTQDGTTEPRQIACWQCGFKNHFFGYNTPPAGGIPIATFGNNGSPQNTPKMRLLGMLPTGSKELGSYGLNNCPWLQRIAQGMVKPVPPDLLSALSGMGLEPSSAKHLRLVVCSETGQGKSGNEGQSQNISVTGTVVFDTRKGNSIIFTERRLTTETFAMVDSTKSFLRDWDGYWYPARIVSERKMDGQTQSLEDVSITELRINKDEKFDTLRAMNIATGAMVVGAPGYDGSFKWDGSKIVPVKVRLTSLPYEDFIIRKGDDTSWILLLVNVGVIVGILALILLRRKKSKVSVE